MIGMLTPESAEKLQKILSKRVGRKLTKEELEEAYEGLMGFAYALLDLESAGGTLDQATPTDKYKQLLERTKYSVV